MDVFEHVNNVVYFRWFESARIAYFEKLAFSEMHDTNGIGPILGSTNAMTQKLCVANALGIGENYGDSLGLACSFLCRCANCRYRIPLTL